ncbi:hypothetical protein PsAD2_01480 [Pseudovibrio axinellae]|uniref:Uncharacterized protein n=1 Tax=Pseudovibrio axinellae TaxID=989403 RepID=A0A165ZQX1_9HYPH|nr:hypothetical protein [Pseudovibrio axinellae]KZL20186.1 hypothetical protein PsAD2_01480 [Pseudovibrio axinellae]SEQ60137.1 hypothetical protein SAMN05421798_103201 [Pseudovibrio axinellae]
MPNFILTRGSDVDLPDVPQMTIRNNYDMDAQVRITRSDGAQIPTLVQSNFDVEAQSERQYTPPAGYSVTNVGLPDQYDGGLNNPQGVVVVTPGDQ